MKKSQKRKPLQILGEKKKFQQEVKDAKSTLPRIRKSGLISNPRIKMQKAPMDIMKELEYEELDREDMMIQKQSDGKIQIDVKLLAIMFCEAFTREYVDKKTKEVKLLPNFAHVGKLIGHHGDTVRLWWIDRAKIQAQRSKLVESGLFYVQSKIIVELMRMVQVLSDKDYGEMKDKDFTILFNTLINKVRLLSGMSTANVAHAHRGSVELVAPEEAEL